MSKKTEQKPASLKKYFIWLLYLLIGVGIPAGLGLWNGHLEKTAPQRLAAARESGRLPPKVEKCLSVSTHEIRNTDGSLKETETRQYSIPCNAEDRKPYEFPSWLYWTFIVIGILLLLFTRNPVPFF